MITTRIKFGVIAGSREAFEQYLKEIHGSSEEYVFIEDEDMLELLDDEEIKVDIILYGNYTKNSAFDSEAHRNILARMRDRLGGVREGRKVHGFVATATGVEKVKIPAMYREKPEPTFGRESIKFTDIREAYKDSWDKK